MTAQTTGSKELNIYGFAAVGGLVGLASEQAARKLVAVFSTIFTTAEAGKDPRPPTNKPPVTGAPPTEGASG